MFSLPRLQVSAPVDLMAAGDALGRGFNLVYTRAFLATMKKKGRANSSVSPDSSTAKAMRRAPHAARVRRGCHRASARIPRYRRLLDARERETGARKHRGADFALERP